MDLLHFLTRRLRFVQNLYDSAAATFEERKRQIEAGEPPYLDERDAEHCDGEPTYLAEWQETDDSVMVVGHWCLCMVLATLQTYLRDCISPFGSLWWDSSIHPNYKHAWARRKGTGFNVTAFSFLTIWASNGNAVLFRLLTLNS